MVNIRIEEVNHNKEQVVCRNVQKKYCIYWKTYKNYRNKLHKLLKNAERSYYNEQILTETKVTLEKLGA